MKAVKCAQVSSHPQPGFVGLVAVAGVRAAEVLDVWSLDHRELQPSAYDARFRYLKVKRLLFWNGLPDEQVRAEAEGWLQAKGYPVASHTDSLAEARGVV